MPQGKDKKRLGTTCILNMGLILNSESGWGCI